MRISGCWLRRHVVGCVMLCLFAPFCQAATARPPQASQQEGAVPSNPVSNSSSKDATPGAGTVQPPGAGAVPGQSPTDGQSSQDGAAQPDGTSSSSGQQQNTVSPPVGTAVAPYEKPFGAPASRPAGAVIAPAKQRRTRSFLIRVGVILAAAGAVGAVVGLSKASPSHP